MVSRDVKYKITELVAHRVSGPSKLFGIDARRPFRPGVIPAAREVIRSEEENQHGIG